MRWPEAAGGKVAVRWGTALRPLRWAAPADRGTPAVARAPLPLGRVDLRGLFAVLADRRRCSGGDRRCRHPGSLANRSAPHPTRLETRTKESNMCASHWAANPQAQ